MGDPFIFMMGDPFLFMMGDPFLFMMGDPFIFMMGDPFIFMILALAPLLIKCIIYTCVCVASWLFLHMLTDVRCDHVKGDPWG